MSAVKPKKWLADVSYQQADLSKGIYQDLAVLYTDLLKLDNFPMPAQLSKQIADKAPAFAIAQRKFVEQDEDSPELAELGYEAFINQTGLIPTRKDNWHDFFNALIWGLFPASKQAINQLHVADISEHGLKKRTKQRDALTLFDECGIILAYTHDEQKNALRNHMWVESFWDKRSQWYQSIRPFVFGHAMYEMALAPYIGLTAKAYFIKVDPCFFSETLSNQYRILDSLLAKEMRVDKTLSDNKKLSPLPILGVPTWYQDNQQQSFYLNTNYFRPKRRVSDKG
ncbi:DUF3025 domain-containing protein [Catenovulum agarivorans]|uniref:DUF3025 domain-containing protein n=1 Tax=Catenovulum agarivorans TaxID=1172192 RepID=UPI0002D937AA|nr:DUF3025 domain-containing protein [Catenovulum agarivorans]